MRIILPVGQQKKKPVFFSWQGCKVTMVTYSSYKSVIRNDNFTPNLCVCVCLFCVKNMMVPKWD